MSSREEGVGGGNVQSLAEAAYRQRGKSRPLDVPDWWPLLALTQRGTPTACLHNVVTVLTRHPEWSALLRLDQLANRIVLTRETPYGRGPGELIDVDAAEIAAWMGDPGNVGMAVSSGVVMEAAEMVATREAFHPVQAYLEGLAWDGEARLPHLFPDHFGTARDEYTMAVGVNFMVSAVARAMSPGCKVDFMVVLEGAQGLGKTRAVRRLFGRRWYAEAMESPASKDFYQSLVGRWGVEISEMHAFSKAEVNKVKQAITTQEDVYRPSYGRLARVFPRHCVFVGTTNDDDYLRDHTGGRRFLPVRCTEINVTTLEGLRDQLWAEATVRYREGHAYWHAPSGATDEQDARFQEDSWTEPIREWLLGEGPSTAYPQHRTGPIQEITITELMQQALGIEIARHTRPDQMRVGHILKRMGWTRHRVRQGHSRGYVYRRTDPHE